LILTLIAALLVGCGMQAASESADDDPGYSGALDTTAEGALDATTQLALGTLKLEDTPDAVTEDQVASLLPLWQALQGGALKGTAERDAVLRQIEGTMSETQISVIAAMRLTAEDIRSWAQSQGPGTQGQRGQRSGAGQRPSGQGAPSGMTEEQIAQMRKQFQNMSSEERATRRAQFSGQGRSAGQGGPGAPAGDASPGLVGAVVTLLSERSGVPAGPRGPSAGGPSASGREQRPSPTPTPKAVQETAQRVTPTPSVAPAVEPTSSPTAMPEATPPLVATQAPAATPTPTLEPATYVVQAGDSLAAIAQAYGVTVAALVEANDTLDPHTIRAGQVLAIPNPAQALSSGITVGSPAGATEIYIPALEQLADNDPGPPFTVEVSAHRATQDPLVDASQNYLVTGIVRNDGDQFYAVSAIHATFFDADGFRGSYRRFPGRGRTGGEWIWHGKTEADFPCLLLAPGEECPFSVEITAQDMASFVLHPDASVTERESAPVELSDLRTEDQGTGYLRISGTAGNPNPFKVKNVTVVGVLLDARDEIVSMGSTYVLQEDIEPGGSVPFELHIEKEPYVRTQLYAQAERDWK
jgi:LysM repeat protein